MKPNFKLHHNENPSLAIVRLYKHIRTMQRDYVPISHFAKEVQAKRVIKPILRVVK